MKNFYVWLFKAVLLLSVVLVSGCYQDEKANGVAVIDLDRVAAAIGRDKLITARVGEYAKQQEINLNKLKNEFNSRIADEKKKLGKKPKKKEQERINQLASDYTLQLRQEINKVSQTADRLRSELVLDFRKEIEPVARRVAESRKLSVVMVKQNAMLYIDPAIDITNAVIDEIQKYEPAVEKSELK